MDLPTVVSKVYKPAWKPPAKGVDVHDPVRRFGTKADKVAPTKPAHVRAIAGDLAGIAAAEAAALAYARAEAAIVPNLAAYTKVAWLFGGPDGNGTGIERVNGTGPYPSDILLNFVISMRTEAPYTLADTDLATVDHVARYHVRHVLERKQIWDLAAAQGKTVPEKFATIWPSLVGRAVTDFENPWNHLVDILALGYQFLHLDRDAVFLFAPLPVG